MRVASTQAIAQKLHICVAFLGGWQPLSSAVCADDGSCDSAEYLFFCCCFLTSLFHYFHAPPLPLQVMGPEALLRDKIKQTRHREGYEEGLSSSHK